MSLTSWTAHLFKQILELGKSVRVDSQSLVVNFLLDELAAVLLINLPDDRLDGGVALDEHA